MSDLIDRQLAIDTLMAWEEDSIWDEECLKHRGEPYWISSSDVVENLPSAQPEKVCIANVKLSEETLKELVEKAKAEIVQSMLTVIEPEIIRCKDCKWWSSKRMTVGRLCSVTERYTDGEFFCKAGRSKDE